MFTYSIKRACEIRKFHVVVVQRRQRKVQVAWCTCKLLFVMKTYYFLPFSLPSPWSFALLSSRNSATMVTWRHTSPLYSVWKLINLFVNDTITAFCRTICLPSFISNVTNYKDKLWKTARLTSKFKNHDCNLCFSSFQVCHSVSPLYLSYIYSLF